MHARKDGLYHSPHQRHHLRPGDGNAVVGLLGADVVRAKFVRIDAEICAGAAALTANPQSWFGTATDSRSGGTAFFGSTFSSDQIAPGTCVSGMADVELPIDATIRDIMFTDESTIEVARWRVG